MTKRHTVLIAILVFVAAACDNGGSGPSSAAVATGPKALTDALAKIEDLPKYKASDWGYSVLDQKTGAVVAAQNADHYFDPGSTMKTYSVSTALRLLGPDYQFHTPVYRTGTVSSETLNGNLILVGSGDLSFGLREQPDGTLYYENLPDLDHSYASIGLSGAVEPPGDPLSGLNELASRVRASGVTQVNGNVVVDDRLFSLYDKFPDGLMSPIWVNENLIDVEVSPGRGAGQPTSINWRPMTASYTVDNQVTTVAANQSGSLKVAEETPGHLVVTGTIAAGAKPTLVVAEVKDPAAFARTAFIEALQRAGVTVTGTATGANPVSLLPAKDSYQEADMLGEHVSPSLAQYASLILKVSYNRGADLMTCLSAVKTGSTDCKQGLVASVDTMTQFGLSKIAAYPYDGAGSDDQGRSTASGMAMYYKEAAKAPWGNAFVDALPTLGKTGTLANVLVNSPAAGKVKMKTGNRVGETAAGQVMLLGNSLAGYVEAKSGRELIVMIAVVNVPISSPDDIFPVTLDQARMVEAIQQSL